MREAVVEEEEGDVGRDREGTLRGAEPAGVCDDRDARKGTGENGGLVAGEVRRRERPRPVRDDDEAAAPPSVPSA